MERVLEQVALSAGLQGAKNMHIALVGRQHDHSCVRELGSDGDERVEAIHLRHLNIHQRHIRTVRAELLDRFATVGGLCDHRHIRLNLYETGDPIAHDRMIVHRENPDGRAVAAHDPSPPTCRAALNANSRDHQERRWDGAYTMLAGRRSSTSVPAPTSLHTASFPRIWAARSGMPRRP